MVIGTPLAFGVARTRMRGKSFVRAAVVLALVSPEFLIAMGYILIAGPNAGYANVALRDLLGSTASTGPFDIFTLWGLVMTALPNGSPSSSSRWCRRCPTWTRRWRMRRGCAEPRRCAPS